MSEQLLRDVREIQELAKATYDAMTGAEQPSCEDAGIAFVCAERILEIVDRLELDLMTASIAGTAA